MSIKILYRSGKNLVGMNADTADGDNPVVNILNAATLRHVGKPVRLLSYLARDPFVTAVEPYLVDVDFKDIATE